MTLIFFLLLFLAAWVGGGWVIDDLHDQAEYTAAHPPRHRPTVLIGDPR